MTETEIKRDKAPENTNEMPLHEDRDYPEYPLKGRIKLAYQWVDANSMLLLDAGCAHGYGTRFFKQKSHDCFGIDPDEHAISIAKNRYPDIQFCPSHLEALDFPDEHFDTVILADVLEHVQDEQQTLNEIFRVLKSNGTLILTVPHRGLFWLFDPANYSIALRNTLPGFYRRLYRILKRRDPKPFSNRIPHRHYTMNIIQKQLESSLFKKYYHIEKVFRSGLLMGVLEDNMMMGLQLMMPRHRAMKLLKPLTLLARIEYWIPYGPFAYNLALKIRKQ